MRTDNAPSLVGQAIDRPILEVENLCVDILTAKGPIRVVNGLSYEIPKAKSIAIVGESGAGKSVSVRALLGLLNRRKFVVSGSIKVDGVDLEPLSIHARRRLVAGNLSLVFQDPTRSLNPTMRVGWQIAESMMWSRARPTRMKKSEARERALQLMRDVGIADPDRRFYSFPHELSGGMRQRVVIAIALSCDPKVIFCDEPTTSLDVTTQAQIMDLLQELQERLSLSVVLITHDLALAVDRVEEVMVIYAGQFVEKLSAGAVATNPRMPYTRALLAAVPGAQQDGSIPKPIRGAPPDPRDLPSGCSFNPRCEFATDECRETLPGLDQVGPGHLVRCWHPDAIEAAPLLEVRT